MKSVMNCILLRVFSSCQSVLVWALFNWPSSRRAICSLYRVFSPNSVVGLIGGMRFSKDPAVRRRAAEELGRRRQEFTDFFQGRDVFFVGEALLENSELFSFFMHYGEDLLLAIFLGVFLRDSDSLKRCMELLGGVGADHEVRDRLAGKVLSLLAARRTCREALTLHAAQLQGFQYPVPPVCQLRT